MYLEDPGESGEKSDLEYDQIDRETPLKRFITILFEPHFKILVSFTAYLSIVCCIIDFSYQIEAVGDINTKHEQLTLPSLLLFLDAYYFLYTLFMLLYKKMNWFEMQVLYPPNSTLHMLLDFITVIPFDVLYKLISLHPNMDIIVSLRLRYLLRAARLYVEIRRRKNSVGHNRFIEILMEYIVVVGLTLFFTTGIVYILYCAKQDCTQNNQAIFQNWLYETTGKVTGNVFHARKHIPSNILYVHMIVTLIMYIYSKGFIMAKFVNAFKQNNLPRCVFAKGVLVLYKRYDELLRRDHLLKSTVKAYFASLWKTRAGVLQVNVQGILTDIRQSEIKLDLSWKFFQHSHLFRGEELHYLHHLSRYVQTTFKSCGEVLYKKDQIKTNMIYIASGTIEFYSDEDGETPVLTFSGGTCLGETALIIRSKSVCTVVCKTDCEIDILEARDFVNVMKKYPDRYQKTRKAIHERFSEAKSFHKVKAYHRTLLNIKESSQLLSIKWIKIMLNVLSNTDTTYFDTFLRTTPIEERLLINKLTKLLFCPNFLDLLVLAKNLRYKGDRVFIKPKFPCILQPISYLTHMWDKIIAILVLIYLFVYPMYMAFYQDLYIGYIFFITFVTFMWILDVFIQCSTGIHTPHGILKTRSEICSVKFSQIMFILDVFAMIPLELFPILIENHIKAQRILLLQCNRALKITKLRYLFDSDQYTIRTNNMFINCCKTVLYLIILIYWIGSILYLFITINNDKGYYSFFNDSGATTRFQRLTTCYYLSTIIVTGYNLYLSYTRYQSKVFYIPLSIVAFVVTILYYFLFCNITATESIRLHDSLALQQYYGDVKFILDSFKFDQDFLQRILCYTNHQWLANNGIDFLDKNQILQNIPRELYLIIRRSSLADYAENLELFQEIPSRLLTEYCGYFSFWDIPAGQILTYSGEVAGELYIIGDGYCEVISADGQIRRTISKGDSFAVLETCLKIPIVHNVVALTDCFLISLTYNDFIQASSNYPQLLTDFKQLSEETLSGWAQQELEREEINLDLLKRKKIDNHSFVKFGFFLDVYSEQGRQFFLPFENLGYFSFVRYFLFRYTIRCSGKFVRYWELLRSICSVVYISLNVIPYIGVCRGCVLRPLVYTLDAYGLLDIYVRHHITYYNEYGIEVTHPIKTAAHYWKTSFILDLLAMFPFLRVIEVIYGDALPNRILRGFLRYNKFFLVHRIVQGFGYLREGVEAKVKLWTVFMCLPPIFMIILCCINVAFNRNCVFSRVDIKPDGKLFTTNIRCDNHSWITGVSDFRKPFDLNRVFAYHMYYVVGFTTSIGLHGFYITNISQAYFITVASFISFLIFEFTSAKIIAINLSRNVNLTIYQEATAVLLKFLNLRRIDDNLKTELVQHFEYEFFKMRGIRYETVFSKYNTALKEEALYKIFGSVMRESDVFQGARPSFFRSLFLHVKHQIILRRGIISRVNDVSSTIFFIFKGEVEVLAPDYSRMLILPKGSLFGNLDDVPYSRRTLTMIAKGHVELLEIKTTNFYIVLNRYAKLKLLFKKMTMMNTDYLTGGPLPKLKQIPREPQKQKQKRDWKHTRTNDTPVMLQILRKLSSIHQHTKLIVIWEYFILVFVCFFGFIIEFYRFTMIDKNPALTILLYIFDFLYVIKIYIKFHMSFINEVGIQIRNRRAIAKHYIKKRTGFVIDIITIIPIEFIAFAFYNNTLAFWPVFIYCRFNRFLRLFFVGYQFHRVSQKISVNIYRVKALQMLVFIIITLEIATAIMIHCGCTDQINTYPKMPCKFNKLHSSEKFSFFLDQLSNVLAIFTSISFRKYYPDSFIMICLLTFYALMCRVAIPLFMAEICATWEVILHNRHTYEQTINKYKKLITMQRLSPVLIEKTWNYFRLLWGKQSGLQFPTLLEEAPYYLREAVLNSMFGHHLRNHPVLKGCHVDLIRQMAAEMRTQIFFPGDYIAYKGDIDDSMYFIHEGEILGLSVDTLRTEVVDVVLKTGDMFGLHQGMYPRIGHEFTYRANQYTVVVVLKRMKWIHLLDFYPASKVLVFDENFLK